jgi:hypothetical protein
MGMQGDAGVSSYTRPASFQRTAIPCNLASHRATWITWTLGPSVTQLNRGPLDMSGTQQKLTDYRTGDASWRPILFAG